MMAKKSAADLVRDRLPSWVAGATRVLSIAASRVRVISANTPSNLRAELDRLATLGDVEAPRFSYDQTMDLRDVRRALAALIRTLMAEGELGALYAARATELDEEAALCEHAGSDGLWAAARVRYARRDGFDEGADTLADGWLAQPATTDDEPRIPSDDARDPRSLYSRLGEEIGRRRLPFRLLVVRDIASLAATGEGFVQVAGDRQLTRADVERTVLHEIEGHVLPRVRASAQRLSIFAIGTARGADDQEGRALHLERRRGFLDPLRRRELALRHLAARSVEARADFVSTARLLASRGASRSETLRVTARVHRGGGLAREAVYLPALLRVESALEHAPDCDAALSAGRVAVSAAPSLIRYLDSN